MAINAQKFLPPSRTFAALKPSSVGTGGGTLVRIEKKVITLDKLVKNNLFLQKKGGALALREKNALALQEKEKELEKEKPKKVKGLSIPKLPGFGFLGWVKNWIFNTILGFFVVRMIDHLPKMIKMASFVGPAMEGILNFSGSVLNGIISFIDAGYKAVEATRGLVGKTFGNDALKQFDTLANNFENFMNLAIIAAMASSDAIMGSFGKKSATKGAGKIAGRGAGRIATRAGSRVAGKAGAKFGAKIGSKFLKAIPFVGTALAVIEGVMRLQDGDPAGALLSFGSAIPVLGWGFLGADILRQLGVLKFAGGGYVRRPRKYAGGGFTSPRTLSKKPAKRRVSVAPQKIKPGSDVGGQKKVEQIFPKAPTDKKNKIPDPLGYLETASNTLGKANVFGPLFTIAIKTVLGNKPSSLDYKNAGVALNGWVSNNFASVGKFARGGEVDGRMLFTGEDMSDAIAKAVQTSVSSEVDKTINDLMKQLMLRKEGEGEGAKPTSEEVLPEGAPSLIGNTNAEKVFNYLVGYGFTEQAAAGIIGNLMQESGVNPMSKQLGGGPGRGIMQWGTGPGSGGRWDALVAWATSSGKDPWKLDTQVEWMMKEMRSYGTLNRLKGVTDVKKAVEIFEREMEKAGVPNYPRRYRFAADALASFGKGKAGGGAGVVGTESGSLEKAKLLARSMGLQITSSTRGPRYPGDTSLHISGRAIDFSNDSVGKGTPEQLAFANAMISRYGSSLSELIYTPLGFSIKNGKKVSPIDPSNHYHHVHVAFAKGGRIPRPTVALMGEKGQEFVFDADTTRGLDSMAPGFLDYLNKAKTKPELANILRTYGDEPEVVFVPIPMPSQSQPPMSIGGKSSSGGVVNSQDNSWMFDRLATGTG